MTRLILVQLGQTSILFCLALSIVTPARAQETYRLEYVAPDACPNAEEFGDEVAARVGLRPFSDDSLTTVRVRIDSLEEKDGSAGYVGQLVTTSGAWKFDGVICTAVVQDLAAALSVQMQAPAHAEAATPTPQTRGDIDLRLESDQPNLTLNIYDGQSSATGRASNGTTVHATAQHYRRLCTAPCRTKLTPGQYRFGVSSDDGAPVLVDGHKTLLSTSTLTLAYENNIGYRLGAYGILIAGVGLAAGLFFPAVLDEQDGGAEAALYIGAGVALLAGVIGYILLGRPDVARIEF